MEFVATNRPDRKMSVVLWILQSLLAALFMVAGVMKFIMPIEEMTKQIVLPGWFLHFIGAAEILGAIGLILPGILRIRVELTALAAAGLAILTLAGPWHTLAGGRGAAATIHIFATVAPAFVAS